MSFIDLDKVYEDGLTLFEKSILDRYLNRIEKFCFEKRKNMYKKEHYFNYIDQNNMEALYCCIKNGVDSNKEDTRIDTKRNGLMLASYSNRIKIVRMYVEIFNVDINK